MVGFEGIPFTIGRRGSILLLSGQFTLTQRSFKKAVKKCEAMFDGDELEMAVFAISRGFTYKGIGCKQY